MSSLSAGCEPKDQYAAYCVVLLALFISGCSTGYEQYYEPTYKHELERCLKKLGYETVYLTADEYKATLKYRSKIDPDLDDRATIEKLFYEPKREAIRQQCERDARFTAEARSKPPAVSVPVIFVAPAYLPAYPR